MLKIFTNFMNADNQYKKRFYAGFICPMEKLWMQKNERRLDDSRE